MTLSKDARKSKKQKVIEIKQVDVIFNQRSKNPFYALNSLSLEVDKGTIFCLLGPNGSGKTTTINLINGLLKPSKGNVRVLGLRPDESRKIVLQKIALVPQETALYNELTARENLEFHGQYYGIKSKKLAAKIDEVLEVVQLTDRQKDRVGSFSGGMQRRLALARALLTDPEILLLDEPTLGVDVQSRSAIWEQIRQLANSGKTVVLTTNYMEEAETLAKQIFIIDQGSPVISGTLQELQAHLQQKQLVFHFISPSAAQESCQQIDADYNVTCEEEYLSVEVGVMERPLSLLQQLLSRLPQEKIRGMKFKEPNLQDVFLHYTGRALRD